MTYPAMLYFLNIPPCFKTQHKQVTLVQQTFSTTISFSKIMEDGIPIAELIPTAMLKIHIHIRIYIYMYISSRHDTQANITDGLITL